MSGTDEQRAELAALTRPLLDAVADLRRWLVGPPAPDEQVRSWRLYTGAEYGGVLCAEPDCDCECEASEIVPGGWPDDDEADSSGRFSLDELHAAVAEHIGRRAEQRAEELAS